MFSILSQTTIIFLALVSLKAQDNPEKEFETYLKNIDETIREIARKYQQFEKTYRIQSIKTVKLLNRSISETSNIKEFEKSLRKILSIYSPYLKGKLFVMNDVELIHPKKVCTKADEAISEYESVMMTFLATNSALTSNVTLLNTELKVINSSNVNVNSNATEAQNASSEIVDRLQNLVNASVDFQVVANQAAFNTSNILISLKTRTTNYCGVRDSSMGNEDPGKRRRTTKKTCTKRTMSRSGIGEETTRTWKNEFQAVDRN